MVPETLPDIGDSPHQPRDISFPKRSFGKKKIVMRSFHDSWFDSWSWLHYHEEMDVAFCHVCVQALKEKKMEPHCCDAAFVSTNFSLTNFNHEALANLAEHGIVQYG